MLTAEGLNYAESVASSYQSEAEIIENQLRVEKHTISYDRASLLLKRYLGG
jgi:hypothetical protein